MSITPQTLSLLGRAAERRASGAPWTDAAKELEVAPDELRRLAADHRTDYDRLARRARTEFTRDTLAAALGTLRELTRSSDERVRLLAASTLVRYEISRMRYTTRDAADRVLRDARRQTGRARITSESAEVPTMSEVAAAKNVAQPTALAPAPASAISQPKQVATPPVNVARPPVSPAMRQPVPLDQAARLKQRLVDAFARGEIPLSSMMVGDRPVQNWLRE